ncbi:MAG: ABC transporter ATP-binding protein [Sandaracinus sp.]|nr:ABC transporter ATP-binding protein [Sandaracinus sp.]MCB9613092.1 ABC transporter ATP-binding protein [Sandaracinus sp.]MCB9624641.1 ABC transporter ATP-binding protein [Sandaracinus sp.]MCB9632778.1 ABC transporter ATP-binding protein [Sandaracinus sp.]
MSGPILELEDLHKSFGEGEARVEVLHGIDLTVHPGELVALIGPSGSGKSTLLNLLGLLDRATSGSLRLQGREVGPLDDDEITRLRGDALGFVFQFHHLVPALSVVENVMMPAAVRVGGFDAAMKKRALNLLDAVGLQNQGERYPRQLSGGMQQRVAVARALMNDPPLVLADEPTGNLDTHSSDQVFDLLRERHRELGTAFVIVTHDPTLAARCERVIRLVDGRLVADGTPDEVLEDRRARKA